MVARDLVIVNTSIVYGCERPGYSLYFNSLWLPENENDYINYVLAGEII